MVTQNGGRRTPEKKYPLVLDTIYNSDLPASEKTPIRLAQEGITLILAGIETTALSLSTTTYHLLANPHLLQRLQTELQSRFPTIDDDTMISYRDLEKLPFLSACINEGLRLASGVSARLPRIDPKSSTTYGAHTLPAGTVISMSLRDILYDPSIYPDPRCFKPDRWLEDPDRARRRKERFLVPFGTGARICAGMHLATAEMHALLGNVLRRFEAVELFETVRADLEMAYEFFAPFGRVDSKGLRVRIG